MHSPTVPSSRQRASGHFSNIRRCNSGPGTTIASAHLHCAVAAGFCFQLTRNWHLI